MWDYDSNRERTVVPHSSMKRFILSLISIALVSLAIQAQEQAAARFEVASIRLDPDCAGAREQQSPGRFGVLCVSLREVIRVAYGNVEGPAPGRLPEVLGGPRWIDTDRYDILATAPGNPGLDQMYGPMTRALLEDRFALKLHDEVTRSPVYNLTALKQPAKLKPIKDGSCVQIDLKTVLQSPTPPNYCGRFTVTKGDTTVFDGHGVTITEFIARALRPLDRPVIDLTGLTGRFDIHFEFASINWPDSPNSGEASAPSVFTAIEEQLGLKLSAATGPVKVHIIDQVERPTEN
jgi:uncharacterized protein (TIGR03435 family)